MQQSFLSLSFYSKYSIRQPIDKCLAKYNIQWDTYELSMLQQLQNNHDRYYTILQSIQNIAYMLQYNILHGGYIAFKKYNKQNRQNSQLCLAKNIYMYQCYDCYSNYNHSSTNNCRYVTICSQCFNPDQHKQHYYKIVSKYQDKYCQCGLYWRNQVNVLHHSQQETKQTNVSSVSLSKQDKYKFVAFFHIAIKIIINNVYNAYNIQQQNKQKCTQKQLQTQIYIEKQKQKQKQKQVKKKKHNNNNKNNKTDKQQHILQLLFKLLSQLAQHNQDYQQLIVQVLCNKYTKTMTNLSVIINIHLHIKQIYKYFDILVQKLLHIKQFTVKLIQTIFTIINPKIDKDKQYISKPYGFYDKIYDNYNVISQLANNNIIVYNSYNKQQYVLDCIIQYYLELRSTNNQYQYQQQCQCQYARCDKFVEIWKYFVEHNSLIYRIIDYNIESKQQYYYISYMLKDCVFHPDLLLNIINYYLQRFYHYHKYNKHNNNSSNNSNNSKVHNFYIYKWFTSTVLTANSANISQILQFISHCNKQHIQLFIQTYFGYVYTLPYQQYQFDLFVAKLLFAISQHFNISFMPTNVPKSISGLQFAMKLKKVIMSMIYQQHLQYVQLLKVAKINKNIVNIQLYQNKLVEWFQQFLYTSQQISQKQIVELKNKGIITNQKCKNILSLYTHYNDENKIFKYIGPQIKVESKFILANLNKKAQIYNICYKQKDSLFYNQFRYMMLNNLFNSLIQKIYNNVFYYLNIDDNDRQLICVTAVLFNKITNETNINIHKYIDKLIENTKRIQIQNETNSSFQYICKLLGLQKYNKQQLSIKCENTEKKQQEYKMNESCSKLKQKTKIMKSLELTSKQKQNKLNKLRKFKQKFTQNSHKFLQQAKIEQQVDCNKIQCLICKQGVNDYGFMYYFFVIKSNPLLSLYAMNNNMQQVMLIDSCCHTVHQSCLKANKNKYKCILCSQISNFLVPVLQLCENEQLRNQIVTYWWKTQMQQVLKQDKQAKNKNKQLKKVKPQQQKLQLQIIFAKLFRMFVSSLGCDALFKKNKKQNKLKFNILLLQMKDLYSHLRQSNKQDRILELIQINSKQKNKFIQAINKIISKLLIRRICESKTTSQIVAEESMQEYVWAELNQIKNELQMKYATAVLSNISWLLEIEDNRFAQQFILKQQVSFSTFCKQLSIFKLVPKTMQQFNRIKKNACFKCYKTDFYYCITCQQAFCNHCVKINSHIQNMSAIKSCVCINQSGLAFYQPKHSKYGVIKQSIYYNVYWQPFQAETSYYKQYKLNQEKLFNIFNCIM